MTMATALPRLSVDSQRVWDLGYELLQVAHSTRFCDIWEVRHRTSYDLFAWKQLKPEYANDRGAQQMLQNEVAVSRLVQSALLPKIVGSSVNQPPYYLLSEWFSRDTLEQAIQEFAPLPIGLCLWIVRQCAEGLQALVQAGLNHGDFQANHILIRENGTICLTELGLAHRLSAQLDLTAPRRLTPASGPLDDYVSVTTQHQPPQGLAKDVHGLGVLLYRSLTGHFPFEQITAADMVNRQPGDPGITLRRLRSDVSERIAILAADLLSPDPQRRPGNVGALVHRMMELELEQFLK